MLNKRLYTFGNQIIYYTYPYIEVIKCIFRQKKTYGW